MKIGKRIIGDGHPVYVVAEMSANHNNSFERACEITHAAHRAGADAVKVQTYRAETMTIDCDREAFIVKGGSLWDGQRFFDLYAEASMPWEWQPELKRIANRLGMDFFSTPFDSTAVEFLESLDVPVYKIASFEIVDIPLLKTVATTGKPVIVSTGMATTEEIEEALATLRNNGSGEIALLKCVSAYPAPPEEMHLRTIPYLRERFKAVSGLSDHSMGTAVPVAAVSMGASIVEKHFTLSRKDQGPDSAFSLEPEEMREMIDSIRVVEKALGNVQLGPGTVEQESLNFRRSLYAVRDIRQGERLSKENIKSIRPGFGMHPRYYDELIGLRANRMIPRGTPLVWNLINTREPEIVS